MTGGDLVSGGVRHLDSEGRDSTAAMIGGHVLGQFSFLALYPFDTQVILKIPSRWSPRRPGPDQETPERLCNLLNGDQIRIHPDSAASTTPALAFRVEELSQIFTDSPNATWSTLRADLPMEWFLAPLGQVVLPAEVQLTKVKAGLLLFDGGIGILALEPTYTISDPQQCADRLPDLIKKTAEQTVRYKNETVTSFCRSLLNQFASRFQRAVTIHPSPERPQTKPAYHAFADRIRVVSVPEAYPTIITKIWCKDTLRPCAYDLRASDLTRAMYLDGSEMGNALPTFEDDYIAVGYDSAWWLLAANPEERTERFRDRIELTLQYSLAVSMLIYVLHTEIDQELREIRNLRSRIGHPGPTDAQVSRVRSLRGEVEDLLKELSLESFSTWVSDIRLFDTILEHWLVRTSSQALRAKLNTVNVILRELYQENAEMEQRALTRVGTIFAAASLASLFIAAVTLFFTQTQWEAENQSIARVLLFVKIVLVLYLMALPAVLLSFIPRWGRRIRRAIDKITNNRQ